MLTWIKKNWVLIVIIILMGVAFAYKTYANSLQTELLNNLINDKTDEIMALQTKIENISNELDALNINLSTLQNEMAQQNTTFISKINKIKQEVQNKTPEEVLEDWKNSWPGIQTEVIK